MDADLAESGLEPPAFRGVFFSQFLKDGDLGVSGCYVRAGGGRRLAVGACGAGGCLSVYGSCGVISWAAYEFQCECVCR